MHLPSWPRLSRNARRLTEIFVVLAKYGLAETLGNLHVEWLQGQLVSFDGERLGKVSHEARIRLALTELGATFIKLGQMLSTRGDTIGPELADELGKLRSNTPPDRPEVIRALIKSELGKPIEELFSEFDDAVLASGSIGQVHRARLPNGQAVVVKVQHTGIEDKIASDLTIMAYLAEFCQKNVSRLRNYQPVGIVREFRRTIQKELDFACERRNLEEFSRNFADDATVHFPITYPAHCSQRVLTMEMLEGISFEDPVGLRNSGVDLNEMARHGANVYLNMLFRDGFYHSDPHAGNLFLLAGGVIGIIDCGMVGRIDPTLRDEVENMLRGMVQKNTEDVTDAVLTLGSTPPDLDLVALRSDINDFVLEYDNRRLNDFNLSAALNEITDIVRKYHIILPSNCTLLLKTLIMLEGTSRQLSPTFSLAELIQPYEEKSVLNRLSLRHWWERVSRSYHDWDRLLESLPRDLRDVLRRVRAGTYEIHHEHRRLESTVNRLVAGLLTAALFVGSAQLWTRDVPPTLHGVSLPGVLGYVLALFLGYRIFRAIRRSENKTEV
jgi:ubiquinone biosynthesis protein